MGNFIPTSKTRHLKKADEGQALVVTALALVVLMLMAGLGVDVGYLRYQKQQMQKAADAGALAGASALVYGGAWKAAAQNDTTANGFQNAVNGIVVQVDTPWEGPFANQPGYVEVSVSQPQPTFFMRVGGFNTVPVRSWSVANAGGISSGCIYVLDPTDSETFLVDGNVSISSACGIRVDSSDPSALYKNGASGTVTASTIGVVGGYSGSGFSPTPTTGMAPFSDPLAGLPAPSYDPSHCDYTNYSTNSNANLSHGTYCGGISVGGNATVNFASGTYILLGGGMNSAGNTTLIGNGVTFYNTGTSTYKYAPISIAGTAQTTLTAPTTGSLAGILFFQDRSITPDKHNIWSTFDGTNGEVYSGALYFPTSNLEYGGNASLSEYLIIVAWQVEFNGNVTVQNYTLLPGGGGPIHSAILAQ